ncbi:MAG: hypothetical protein A2Z97_02065 [Bdellovibrionales bacterium GWB1_52_6]|nr:MAG: hypothetical protein A2Z97_02065 [Bdellovibrionales bacterium GWB1_52_6]OFZ03764.1 MAG: hypothetical protein A2X97_14525 [Bdellovibrionales bacterium GWA1_52_35]
MLRRRWSGVWVGFFALSFLAQTAFASSSSLTYWQNTKLTFESLHGRGFGLSQSECYAGNENQFLGCMDALKSLAGFHNPPLDLIYSKGRFGVLSVGASDHAGDRASSTLEMYRLEQKRRLNWISLARKIFQAGPKALAFDELFRYLAKGVPIEAQGQASGAMINAYLAAAIDPHTYVMPVAEFEAQTRSAGERFAGIGCMLQKLGQKIILFPMQGGPAQDAGIRNNDVLVSVDGTTVENASAASAATRIRGPIGSVVTLEILRSGNPLKIQITRGSILIQNVQAKILQDRGTKVGWIKLHSFVEEGVCQQIEDHLATFEKKGVKRLILDLRGNPGGSLQEAVCVGGLFVGNKIIVQVKDLERDELVPLEAERMAVTALPLVVLIDAGSASAAEIVAGALQDYSRGWIVGERSFGKGTVQTGAETVFNLMLFATTQRFYQPSGRTNQIVGIHPDFEIPLKPDATEEERFALRESEQYANALPALGKVWVQARPEQVSGIYSCVEKKGIGRRSFEKGGAGVLAADYQLLVALDILSCGAESNTSVLSLRFSERCTLEAVAKKMGVLLQKSISPPAIYLESQITLEKFQNSIEPQWAFRPSAVLNAYVAARNEIFLTDQAWLYLPRGRTLDDSLAHELVHFIQVKYQNVDPEDDVGNETEAVDIQTWFRETYSSGKTPCGN